MWKERGTFNGLSCLPYHEGEHVSVQLPFQVCTREEYENLLEKLTQVDVNNIVELEDNTTQSQELACAGGNCEVE